MRTPVFLATLGLVAALAAPASAQRFNWNDLGAAFCQLSAAGDPVAMRPILSASLASLLASAQRGAENAGAHLPPRFLFQAYDAEPTSCAVRTRNVALVEITRSWSGGSWTDYLVVVPERDGGMRIDDILFATRRSDTLRGRLNAVLTNR